MGTTTVSLLPVFVVLFLVATSLWVYRDASTLAERGTPVRFVAGSIEVATPGVWAVGCLALWVVFVPLYITCRKQAM
jgi:hypothetical protein